MTELPSYFTPDYLCTRANHTVHPMTAYCLCFAWLISRWLVSNPGAVVKSCSVFIISSGRSKRLFCSHYAVIFSSALTVMKLLALSTPRQCYQGFFFRSMKLATSIALHVSPATRDSAPYRLSCLRFVPLFMFLFSFFPVTFKHIKVMCQLHEAWIKLSGVI